MAHQQLPQTVDFETTYQLFNLVQLWSCEHKQRSYLCDNVLRTGRGTLVMVRRLLLT